MSENVADTPHEDEDGETRRDFLMIATSTVGVVGAALAAWPFIDSMNPAADVLAVATTAINLSPIDVGQRVTVVWQGKPVFIDHRTPEQIEQAEAVNMSELIDPQPDSERVQNPDWLVTIGICTHLGCIPTGQKATDPRGEFGGWFCPCHGSHYDTSGRIRKGPAPLNMAIPPYVFVSDTEIEIG
jgi:ubiquinol-cytochrome c reductase iron-sulfur subunit